MRLARVGPQISIWNALILGTRCFSQSRLMRALPCTQDARTRYPLPSLLPATRTREDRGGGGRELCRALATGSSTPPVAVTRAALTNAVNELVALGTFPDAIISL